MPLSFASTSVLSNDDVSRHFLTLDVAQGYDEVRHTRSAALTRAARRLGRCTGHPTRAPGPADVLLSGALPRILRLGTKLTRRRAVIAGRAGRHDRARERVYGLARIAATHVAPRRGAPIARCRQGAPVLASATSVTRCWALACVSSDCSCACVTTDAAATAYKLWTCRASQNARPRAQTRTGLITKGATVPSSAIVRIE